MAWITAHPLVAITYSFLFLAILFLWLPTQHNKKYWLSALSIAVIFGYFASILNILAIFIIICFALIVHLMTLADATINRILAAFIVLVLGFLLKFHYAPGFHNLRILHNVLLTSDATPYTFYLNFDEACVGLFLLGFTHRLITNKKEWKYVFEQTFTVGLIIILLVGALSYLLGFIRFEPKLPQVTLLWAITNLLIVCVAEEAYFRGFLQKNIAQYLSHFKWGHWAAIILTAILFGLLHYPGGIKYIFLATVAGVGYGWIYARTNRIEASILAHFGLNFLQFLLFTYPALASAVKS